MITMAIGLALTAGVISIFSNTIKNSSDFLSMTRVDQDLHSIMEFMVKEVRRAWFVSDFSPGDSTEFYLQADSNTCLRYSYDDDTNATYGKIDNEERFAFRQNGDNLQWGEQATSCTSANSWNNVNDSNVTIIEALKFTVDTKCINLTTEEDCSAGVSTGDKYVDRHQVSIELKGKKKGSTISKTVKTAVRSHNDFIKTQ